MRTIAAIVVVLSLVPAAASAREYEVSWGARVHESGAPSLDPVSSSDLAAFVDAGASTRVGSLPILGRIWLGAQVSVGSWNATNFGNMRADYSTLLLQVSARGVRELHPRIHAYVRGDVGVARSTLTLASDGSTLSDDDTTLAAWLGAGVDATVLRADPESGWSDLALAFRLEAGWMHVGRQSFTSDPERPDDGRNEIELDGSPLGSIDPSGLGFRFGLVGRF